jgi:hypothetical protein
MCKYTFRKKRSEIPHKNTNVKKRPMSNIVVGTLHENKRKNNKVEIGRELNE